MKQVFLFVIIASVVASIAGCKSDDDGKQMSPEESRAQMAKSAADNPNMPPEAKAMQQKYNNPGGQGAEYAKQYGAAQPKK